MAERENDGLNLDDEDRLPWLASAEDYAVEDDGSGRKIAVILLGLLLLAAVVGVIWWLAQRHNDGINGEGELIAAQEGDYKVRPEDADAKEFEGEGDAAFAASEGKSRDAKLSKGGDASDGNGSNAAKPKAASAAQAKDGAMVQLGAFSSADQANAAWTSYSRRFANLSKLSKKVTSGEVDGNTVYRLNAVTGTAAKANELCNGLKAAGENCLVIR